VDRIYALSGTADPAGVSGFSGLSHARTRAEAETEYTRGRGNYGCPMRTRDREPTDRERGELARDVYELAEKWARLLSTPSPRPGGGHVDLVRAFGALTEAIEAETERCVADAREAGVGDRRLGSAWGISKQGAAKKWARPQGSGAVGATVDAPTTSTTSVETPIHEEQADPVARPSKAAVPAPVPPVPPSPDTDDEGAPESVPGRRRRLWRTPGETATRLAAQAPTAAAPAVVATSVAPVSGGEPEPTPEPPDTTPLRLRIGRRRVDGSQRVTYGGIVIGTTRVSRYGTGYIALPADDGPALEGERVYGGPRGAAAALLTHAYATPLVQGRDEGAGDMSAHRPRGTCGVCGRRVALTESDDVWRHDDPGHARRVDGAPVSCTGSWTVATEAPARVGPAQLSLLPLADLAPAEPVTGADGPGPVVDGGGTLPLFTDTLAPWPRSAVTQVPTCGAGPMLSN